MHHAALASPRQWSRRFGCRSADLSSSPPTERGSSSRNMLAACIASSASRRQFARRIDLGGAGLQHARHAPGASDQRIGGNGSVSCISMDASLPAQATRGPHGGKAGPTPGRIDGGREGFNTRWYETGAAVRGPGKGPRQQTRAAPHCAGRRGCVRATDQRAKPARRDRHEADVVPPDAVYRAAGRFPGARIRRSGWISIRSCSIRSAPT